MNNIKRLHTFPVPYSCLCRFGFLKPVFFLLLIFVPVSSIANDSVDAMQTEIVNLRQRVEELESKLNAVLKLVAAEPELAVQQTKPVQVVQIQQKAPATSSIQVGGRLKVDAIYNSRTATKSSNTNRSDLIFLPAAIPIGTNVEKDQINFNARETRLWATASVPTELGTLGGHIEMDFFSSDTSGNESVTNSYVPRLRHAYASYAGFTAGQTWSTFMNVAAIPDKNDAGGPAGLVFVRQPLLSYAFEKDWGKLSIALEQPESTLISSNGSRIATDDERVPDFVARVDFDGSWGNWSIATLLREIRSDNNGVSDQSWGSAVSVSGRIYTTASDNIRFGLSYGNALGRYMSFNGFADASISDNGKIHLNEMFGGFIAYQHWWSDKLRSNLSFGYSEADNNLQLSPVLPIEINRSFFSSHLNLLWSPVSSTTLGIEWIHGERNLEDGRDGKLDRIQLTSMFRF